MDPRLFLQPYADTCDRFVTELGDWLLWGARQQPEPGSPAADDWAVDLDCIPWLLNGAKEADIHALCLLDAAFSAFEGATLDPERPKDYLAVAAAVRATLEAAALAAWLLEHDLPILDRITRLGDLAVTDLAHQRSFLRDLGAPRTDSNVKVCEAESATIVAVLTRLRGAAPTTTPEGVPRFGQYLSTSGRVARIWGADKESRQKGRASYAFFSASAHASLTVIRDLYAPRVFGDVVEKRRVPPGEREVRMLLVTAASALVTVQMDIARRFGWQPDLRAADAMGDL